MKFILPLFVLVGLSLGIVLTNVLPAQADDYSVHFIIRPQSTEVYPEDTLVVGYYIYAPAVYSGTIKAHVKIPFDPCAIEYQSVRAVSAGITPVVDRSHIDHSCDDATKPWSNMGYITASDITVATATGGQGAFGETHLFDVIYKVTVPTTHTGTYGIILNYEGGNSGTYAYYDYSSYPHTDATADTAEVSVKSVVPSPSPSSVALPGAQGTLSSPVSPQITATKQSAATTKAPAKLSMLTPSPAPSLSMSIQSPLSSPNEAPFADSEPRTEGSGLVAFAGALVLAVIGLMSFLLYWRVRLAHIKINHK